MLHVFIVFAHLQHTQFEILIWLSFSMESLHLPMCLSLHRAPRDV